MDATQWSNDYDFWKEQATNALMDMQDAPVPEIAHKARAKADVATGLANAAATMHLASVIDWKLTSAG